MKSLIRLFSVFVLLTLVFSAAAAVPTYAASINPSVTITSTASDPTNLTPIPVTLAFSEPVSGLTLDDLVIANGTASNLASSGVGVSPIYTQVSARWFDTICGLTSNNVLLCWGSNNMGEATVPDLSGGLIYTQVSTGDYHTCALVSDGSIKCWGDNLFGKVNVPALSNGVTYTQVSAGEDHTCGLVSDGSIKCWGWNGFGETSVPVLNGGLTYTQVSAGNYYTCGLVSDGSLKCWGLNKWGQLNVSSLNDGLSYTQVSTGLITTCGLVSDGTIKCWGNSSYGALNVPTLSDGLIFTQVGAGFHANCGLVSDGSIKCWGGYFPPETDAPVLSAGLTYTQLSKGGGQGCGLVSDGSLRCWLAPSAPLFYNTYTFDITPTAPGTVTIDLPAGAVKNLSGKGNNAATQFSIVYTPTYTVSYSANNATSGTVPADQTKTYGIDLTLASNSGSLAKTGYTLTGWNTQSDVQGTHYALDGTYSANAPATLYAEWMINSYPVTYNANTATSGTAPVDQTKTYDIDLTLASNSGSLDKPGYVLTGWNTQSDGLGTHYALGGTYSTNAPASLYAEWTLIQYVQWLQNTSFEQVGLRSLPTLWTPSYATRLVDKLDPNQHHTGKYAMKFLGNRTSKGLLQTIYTSGKSGDKFRISAWSKAYRVPTIGGLYAVRVMFMDGNYTVGQLTLNFICGTHAWQQVTQDIQAPADYTSVRYIVIYQKASGTAWFDDVSLLRIQP
jgi:hypothetical protein